MMRKLLIAMFGVLLITVVGVFVYVQWVLDLSEYNQLIEEALLKSTGKQWRIGGQTTQHIVPVPGFELEGIRLLDEKTPVEINGLSVSISWKNLWNENWLAANVSVAKLSLELPIKENTNNSNSRIVLPHFGLILPMFKQLELKELEVVKGSKTYLIKPELNFDGSNLSGTIHLLKPMEAELDVVAHSDFTGDLFVTGKLIKPLAISFDAQVAQKGLSLDWNTKVGDTKINAEMKCDLQLLCSGTEKAEISKELYSLFRDSTQATRSGTIEDVWKMEQLVQIQGEAALDQQPWLTWQYDGDILRLNLKELFLDQLPETDQSGDINLQQNWKQLLQLGVQIEIEIDRVILPDHQLYSVHWSWKP